MRQAIKRRTPCGGVQTLHCLPAPLGVIEGSRAGVSFIVGVLVAQFQWHLLLYGQHQRRTEVGFNQPSPGTEPRVITPPQLEVLSLRKMT